mmetsp:Transcript_8124/g.9455  ORF Transcript_8124/g.9455 Transcript_8124/m.9455 type:complete len:151 (-) Transcript_8124:122-574(-)
MTSSDTIDTNSPFPSITTCICHRHVLITSSCKETDTSIDTDMKSLASPMQSFEQIACIRESRKRLLLLQHAEFCTKGSRCSCKCCPEVKRLLKHLKTCKDDSCQMEHCRSCKTLLSHHRTCKDKECQVCLPVWGEMKKIRTANRFYNYYS